MAEFLNKKYYSAFLRDDSSALEHYDKIVVILLYLSDIANQISPVLTNLSVCFLHLRIQVCAI